jgi:glycosyltransferase involved in cell wall biosynthesis
MGRVEETSLLYDLTSTQPVTGKYHGGGEYGKHVLDGLLRRRGSEQVHVHWDPNRWIDPRIETLLEREDITVHATHDQEDLQTLLDERQFDRFYTPLPYDFQGLNLGETVFICTIHGLRPIEMPTDRYECKYREGIRGWGKYVAKQLFSSRYVARQRKKFSALFDLPAKKKVFVAPSKHTKYSLLSEFSSLEPSSVRVLYSPNTSEPPADMEGGSLETMKVDEGEYFLFVSAGRWVKNAYRALSALDELYRERRSQLPERVVALGAEGEAYFKDFQCAHRFEQLGYVERSTLEALYRDAAALIYPTLNEGFGYPPLEAMKYGTPVLCSGTTSLHEVCGDAALYFDPYSIREMKGRFLRYCKDAALRRTLSDRGAERYQQMKARQDEMLEELCDLILGASNVE